MATYDEILKKETEEAQKEADRKKLELIQQSNAERKQFLNNSTEAIKAAEASTEKAIKATKDQYANAYDANAVQELISRKNVDETMANLGLSRSGMNESEHARISIARGNADNTVRVAEQKAIDVLTAQLEEIKSQRRQEVSNYLFTSNQELQKNLSAVDDAAKTTAETAAQETYNAEQKSIAEQNAAAQKEAQDIIDTLVSIGVRPDDSIIAASGRSGAWVDAKLQEYTVNRQKEQDKAAASASGGSGGKDDNDDEQFKQVREILLKRAFSNEDYSAASNATYIQQSGLSESDQETLARQFNCYSEWNAMREKQDDNTIVFNRITAMDFGKKLAEQVKQGHITEQVGMEKIAEKYGNPAEGTEAYRLAYLAAESMGVDMSSVSSYFFG